MDDKKVSMADIEKMPEKTGLAEDLQNTSINNMIAQGIKYFDDGLYLEAINEFYPLLTQDDSGLVQQYLARCFFRLEKYKIAYKHFEALLDWEQHKDYATSMMSAIKMLWGQYDEALKMIKGLPPKPLNLINQIYLLYYIHRSSKKIWALDEAEKIILKVSTFNLSNQIKWKYYLACGMLKQASQEYSFAMGNYKYALSFVVSDVDKAKIYNEIGSLCIDMNEFENAEIFLMKSYEILKMTNNLEKGINFKLLGILERHNKNFEKSRWYLQEALKILNEKETYFEACEVHSLLLKFTDDQDFYENASYFTTLTNCENSLKEVTKINEKIIDILDNNYDIDSSDNSNNNRPGIGR